MTVSRLIKEDAAKINFRRGACPLPYSPSSQEFDDRSAEECADGESDEEKGDEEGGGQLLVSVWSIPQIQKL